MSIAYQDENSKKGFANSIVANTTTAGWDAPCVLFKEHYKELNNVLLGNKPDLGYFPSFAPSGKIGLIPNINSVHPMEMTTYDNAWLTSVKNSRTTNSQGCKLDTMSGGTIVGPDQLNQNTDLAVWLRELETVGEMKARRRAVGVSIPVPVWGWDTADVDFSNALGNTVFLPMQMFASGTFVDADVTGNLGENQAGTITVTPKMTDEYDDWIVIKAAEFYGRANKSTSRERYDATKVGGNYNYNNWKPAFMGKISQRGGVVTNQKTYKSGLFSVPGMQYKQKIQNNAMWVRYGMPETGIKYTGSVGVYEGSRQNSSMNYGIEHNFSGQVQTFGNNTLEYNNAPWVSGYYNVLKNEGPVANPIAAGYLYHVTDSAAGGTVNFWTSVSVLGNRSKDILREVYGAQQLAVMGSTSYSLTKASLGSSQLIAIGDGASIYDGCLATLSPAAMTQPYLLAFPDKEHLIAFFADWGILASEDLLEVTDGDNDTSPDDDEPDPDDWGPWDPDSPPEDDWDNPVKPDVPYDPDDPGDDPLPPEIHVVTPATGSTSYILTREEFQQVGDWFMGEDFLKDASNLFTDKMSAVNSVTLFPFDIVAHDSTHCEGSVTFTVAKATKAPQSCYKLLDGYNYWVSGGRIDFGDDFKSLRPDFTTFSHCTYTVFIPCYGNVEVDASAVIYRTLKLDYAVDMVSGSASAVLRSYPIEGYGQIDKGYVVGIYPCQLGCVVPLVSSNTVQRQIAIIQGIASGATGGMGTGKSIGGSIGKGPAGAIAGAVVGTGAGAIAGGVESAMQNPLAFSHTGTIGPMSAWATGFQAQLTVTAVIPAYPNHYEYLMGQQSAQRGYLYKFSQNGLNYVSCNAVKLNVPNATQNEKEAIEAALKEGVYV